MIQPHSPAVPVSEYPVLLKVSISLSVESVATICRPFTVTESAPKGPSTIVVERACIGKPQTTPDNLEQMEALRAKLRVDFGDSTTLDPALYHLAWRWKIPLGRN